jgi:hypothetical protein
MVSDYLYVLGQDSNKNYTIQGAPVCSFNQAEVGGKCVDLLA